jgi:hypothetical protein
MSCNAAPMSGGRRGGDLSNIKPPSQPPAGVSNIKPLRPAGSSRRTRSRRMRGGMGYGFGGTIGTAGPVWDSSWGGEITKSGQPIYDTADRPPVTGGRRRKSRKASKKTKKTKSRRRTMKGGMSVAHASAGFAGTGSRGLADYKDVGGSQPFSNDVVPLK